MKNLRILIALLSTLILAGGFVYAFVLYNPPIKWLSVPRNIEINENGHSSVNSTFNDGGVTDIEAAVGASWNNAGAGNLTTTEAVPSPPASIGDGISTMHFNVVGTGCSGGCLAVTITPLATSGTDDQNGITFGGMIDSDIFFNTSGKFYSDSETDGCNREAHIESVAVHEVGHLLGLAHTPVSNATMFASTTLCSNNGESLAQDDIDGINCIYGNSCGGCVPDTLVVDQTNCDQPTSGPNAGDFVVETFIVDNCGGAVASADVTIDIPNSPLGPLSCSGTTSSTGRLGCALDNPPEGLYESLVGAVSKAGFDPWTGAECGGAGQLPCGCSIEIGGGGCVPTASKEKGPKCTNGLDDDCDGLIDGADPDC